MRLQCGSSMCVSALEADPCAAELVVECPMACDSREERLSLARLDELGVFGFTSVAVPGRRKALGEGWREEEETSKRLQEQQGRTGDIQKQKEEEALKAAALDRRKKALGKLAANSLKKLEEEEQQAERSGDRDKDKGKGKDKDKKKRKKKKKGKKRGESKDREGWGGGGHLEVDVVEGVPVGEREDGKGSADMSSAAAPAPSLDDDSSEADLFDSLPDDEEEGEVIELAVGSSGEARPDTKQVGDDPSLKLVGGMVRPVDMPLNN